MFNNFIIFGGVIIFAIIWYLIMNPISNKLADKIKIEKDNKC